MEKTTAVPVRFIGLDIHKKYIVAIGVNADQETVFGPFQFPVQTLARWVTGPSPI